MRNSKKQVTGFWLQGLAQPETWNMKPVILYFSKQETNR